ncbi:hypothetical protein GQ457_03G012350 [Hibiscus cannabinus]
MQVGFGCYSNRSDSVPGQHQSVTDRVRIIAASGQTRFLLDWVSVGFPGRVSFLHPYSQPVPKKFRDFILQEVLAFNWNPSVKNDYLMEMVNHTNIVLFLKRKDPSSMLHFRPIILCDVIYKMVSKMLAFRFQNVLHFCNDRCKVHLFHKD